MSAEPRPTSRDKFWCSKVIKHGILNLDAGLCGVISAIRCKTTGVVVVVVVVPLQGTVVSLEICVQTYPPLMSVFGLRLTFSISTRLFKT